MTTLIVRAERVGPVLGRHPWVFSGALKNIPEGLSSGEAVKLTAEDGRFLALGYFNSYSQIAVRVWSWEEEVVNKDFFIKRIKDALELRELYVESKLTNAYRLINAENDLLPGLIVDKTADYLCVQFHTKGIEAWREPIVAALLKIIKPKGIYERSDVRDRKREDNHSFVIANRSPRRAVKQSPSISEEIASAPEVPRNDRLLYGIIPDRVQIKENGCKFWVDIKRGQKTGFFLDQRDKRSALAKYVKGKKVLNCFAYTGGFSVYALAAGAKLVTSVDSSEAALEFAEANVKLNKLEEKKCEFFVADVKEYLLDRTLGEFDVIILDPPAFIKDRHKIQEGVSGYKKINQLAMKILPVGGILASASCSAHLTLTDFRFMLSEAAARAGRTLQILEVLTNGIDHPELVAYKEGDYLKCVIARAM